ncbi:MAG: F0F1 ATP synthase subunit epsilon [Deltaproteobacteria bacterium]|nr:F0F1 ATP synthase subunit epsilon [Deltaproteobacteria bacterium]
MADELMVEIVTPEKIAFSGSVEEITIPGSDGEFGVLRGHAPLLSSLEIGVLSFTKDGKRTFYAVNTGYAEVTSSKVTILVETAERSDMIDKARAQKAKDNAESQLTKIDRGDYDYELLRAALARAIARISVSEKTM